MASFDFDNVKAEKEDALWRYNMERKLRIGLRFFGFLLVLFLLSWPFFPALILDAVEAAGDFRRRFVSAFNKPLFTFVVVNIIIVAVYVLSSPRKTQRQNTGSDIYDEYVSFRRSTPAAASNSPVMVENAVAVSQVKLQRKSVDTESKISVPTVKQQQPTKIRTVAKTKPEVSPKQYLRTRSMFSGHRLERPGDREFRRSETTVKSRELAVSVVEPPCKSMEEMSSEEFRSIIDSFIAERKKSLMQENTAQEKIAKK
ncbi:hypothetical protein like AT5G66440 [Hibiscus trionum]|uniref:CYP722 protein n=1 Tax=Hibiscus trionum TaxID=183268 RepID=A0A9W7HJ25_HIBTR|nr:hypothetical protein like AT5G66440 [Hibiscus trionum]